MAKVVVVGAGPAGASAAYHLVSSGHAVTLIDKAEFPRPKTCGDGISQGAVQALAIMGVYPQELEKVARQSAVIGHSLLASPNGKVSIVTHSLKAYCIRRELFDDILYRRAVDAGCSFIKSHIRDLRLGHRDLLGDFDHVIDARGVYAGVANCVAMRAYWRLGKEHVDAFARSSIRVFTDNVFHRGYGWIFPVQIDEESVEVNIGVGVWKEECRGADKSITSYFRRFVRDNPVARHLSEVAIHKSPPRGYHLAVAGKRNEVANEGILKIGDAANLTDPLTGEGIGNAILSGFLVAQAINMSSSSDEAEKNWQTLYERTFGLDFRAALLLCRILKTPRFKNAAMWYLKRRPSLEERFHACMVGASRYSELFTAWAGW